MLYLLPYLSSPQKHFPFTFRFHSHALLLLLPFLNITIKLVISFSLSSPFGNIFCVCPPVNRTFLSCLYYYWKCSTHAYSIFPSSEFIYFAWNFKKSRKNSKFSFALPRALPWHGIWMKRKAANKNSIVLSTSIVDSLKSYWARLGLTRVTMSPKICAAVMWWIKKWNVWHWFPFS